MIGLRGPRWSEAGISNGRRRLVFQLQASRSLSSATKSTFTLPVRARRNTSSPLIRSSWSSRNFQPQTASFSSSRLKAAPITTPTLEPLPIHSSVPPILEELATSTEYETPISEIPEHIGYLKELGLDYGWGPTSLMQFLLEHIHIYTGMPWWASIATLAVCTRLFALKFMITATDQQARQVKVRPMSAPIQQRMMLAMKNNDQIGALKAKQELRAMNLASGIHIWKSFLPIAILIPTGFGQFRLGRGMADLPVPALENESLLWLPDMTISDPFFILPLATGFMVYRTMKGGGEFAGGHASEGIRIFMTYVVPAISGAVMLVWPATLQIYFFVAAVLGFLQATAFRTPWARSALGIMPMPPKPRNHKPAFVIETAVEEQARLAREKASIIDKGIGNVKDGLSKMKSSAVEKMAESGYQVGKGAKVGRRSSQEVKTAESYEERRRREAEMEREDKREAKRRRARK